jgi:hypothetical protein
MACKVSSGKASRPPGETRRRSQSEGLGPMCALGQSEGFDRATGVFEPARHPSREGRWQSAQGRESVGPE